MNEIDGLENFGEVGARWNEYEATHGCHFATALLGGGFLANGLFGFLGSSQAASEQAAQEQAALQFEQGVFGRQENQLLPFLRGGTEAFRQLLTGLGTPQHPGVLTESPAAFGNLPAAPPAYNYVAPTASTFKSSPGYQFQLKQGIQAIQDAAGVKTGATSSNALNAIQEYGTGLANQDWYTFLNNYNQQYANQYAANTANYWNRYNAAANTQGNIFSRLGGVANAGQQAATLTGPQASLAQAIGNQYNTLGATNAAGTLGQFGALGGAFGGVGNNFAQMSLLQQLLGGAGGSNANSLVPAFQVAANYGPGSSYGSNPSQYGTGGLY